MPHRPPHSRSRYTCPCYPAQQQSLHLLLCGRGLPFYLDHPDAQARKHGCLIHAYCLKADQWREATNGNFALGNTREVLRVDAEA